MKATKYIILGIFILLSTLGSLTSLMGQGSFNFSETYNFQEISSQLESTDMFFSYINTAQTHSESSKLGYCKTSEKSTVEKYLKEDFFLSRIPEDLIFAWGASSGKKGTSDLYALKKSSGKNIAPDKSDIAEISIQADEDQTAFNLLISFTGEGATKWASLTRKNAGRNIAIVFDKKVYAAPRVQMEIKEGKCMISGDFSKEDLIELKSKLEN